MKAKQLIIGMVAAAFCALTAFAQDNPPPYAPPPPDNPPPPYNPQPAPPDQMFRGNELALDLFGSGSVNEQVVEHPSGDRITDNGRLGAGAGLTYFATRYVGIGGDAYTENTRHSFIDNASGNIYLRLPIEPVHLAPYIYGGAGYQFDYSESWFGQVGAGVDIRVTHHWGFFVDGRYVMPGHGRFSNYGVGRAGIRLIF